MYPQIPTISSADFLATYTESITELVAHATVFFSMFARIYLKNVQHTKQTHGTQIIWLLG